LKTMSSPGSYAKGYVRWTAGGKRVMWDGNRWQQLCQIDKCLRRDQKSHGVCLLHFREMQENKAKNKSKKLKINTKVPIKKERKSLNSSKTKRSKRMKTNLSLNESTKAYDSESSETEITPKRKTSSTKSQRSSRTLILVCSSLTRQQLTQVELFCTRFSARLSNQIDETTTHLIASEVDQHVCCLTKKVFFATAYHVFVAGFQWIEDCLRKHDLISEDPYEIIGDASLSPQHNGMNRSRIVRQSVFENYSYAIAVECSIGCQQGMFTREELEQLVRLSGAKLIQDSNQTIESELTIIVLCDDDDKLVIKKYQHFKNPVFYVIPEFFLDSLVLYEVQPIKGYELLYQID